MRKVGTLTASVGLIFLGVWMVVNKNNPEIGAMVFKFWPAIFVVLGIEVLIAANKKDNKVVNRINYWVIPVIILFLIVNVFIFAKNKITSIAHISFPEITNSIDISDSFSSNKYDVINATKSLEKYGDKIDLNLKNGDIEIKKSTDDKIKIDANVYVKQNSGIDEYEIIEQKKSEGYCIDFNQHYVKKVKATIYIPNGYDIKVDSTNINFKLEDSELTANVFIDGTNGDVKLDGDISNVKIDMTNANVQIKNSTCKDVDVDLTNGDVSIKTNDDNVKINVDTTVGICFLNGSKYKSVNKKIGDGEGKIRVDITNGVVNIKTQE
ncbi:hypothetical protein CLTEP_06530 [Clostridium tepidiprofundi DSM 19306]|uniref:DUF4097 domain-containing protein n=1 Tax=Clostridium tepidiprofundi DSM 19306 TaxID=1121338 RepID=A0A151B751_9CLOT|nr:DUF4097 family beta strand repeat-containing protein [Clostridium tepidiprofundi]KYH35477.1 hypothetical protein CLTEP_06530 [Clostridium tepidiprofundi DSM 19306]